MRKVIVSNMMTVDGFFAGANDELDWHRADAEFDKFAAEQLHEMDILLFGRRTFEMMASFWPTPEGIEIDPPVAERMNNLPKIVFSKTLKSTNWQNSRIVSDNVADEITQLKHQAGKDMVIFGSGDLISSLAQMSLIDEYRLLINPVILGSGKSMFLDAMPLNLHLLKSRIFQSGIVLLYYQLIQD